MKYVSTRGEAPTLAFDDVLLTGLARDGGLYVPERWPQFSVDEIAGFKGLSYTDMAFRVIQPFVDGAIADADLKCIIADAYSHFDTDEVAPLTKLGDGEWIMELFHGPTLAFKDVAMQFLGPLFDHVLAVRGERICIVGATSGDTGSAAIEACRDIENAEPKLGAIRVLTSCAAARLSGSIFLTDSLFLSPTFFTLSIFPYAYILENITIQL